MEHRVGKTVLLVEPPWRSVRLPGLGAAQLKANLRRAGHPARVLYLNFPFARRVGTTTSEWLSNATFTTLLGEFVFSGALFPQDPGCVARYTSEVLAGTDTLDDLRRAFPDDEPSAVIPRWREEAAAFCDGEGLESILAEDPWLVGFSSSFQQNCAALALLNRVKASRPDIVTVLGGANCGSEMGEELLARFPAIDYVGQGECDRSLVALADALAEGRDGRNIPGMLSRAGPRSAPPDVPLTSAELDDLPVPDFDDFFAQFASHGLDQEIVPRLVMESARGCWWGAKHHCTFCGLNADSLAYRSKSPERVLSEIDALLDRHGTRPIQMADNILDMGYFKSVLPRLAETRRTHFFYETKANLTREQVHLLAEAGVTRIQPGLESLSDHSLRLMRKGSTQAQNVQLLRWCAEYGVGVTWNYLIGFPGENGDEFADIAREAEALHHLQPPDNHGVLRVDRFSPYFHAPGAYGLAPITPHAAYRHVFPFPEPSLARLACFFESEALERKRSGAGVDTVAAMVSRWREAHASSFLLPVPRRKNLVIIDSRRCRRRWVHRLSGVRRRVYEECDRARSLSEITRVVGQAATPDAIRTAVESLVRDRLLLATGGRYLGLAVEPGKPLPFGPPLQRPSPDRAARRRARRARNLALLGRVLCAPRRTLPEVRRRQRAHWRKMRVRWTRKVVYALARYAAR